MSITSNKKPVCEIELIAVLEKIIIAGILTVSDLFAEEGLLAELFNAIRIWVASVGVRQSKVISCVYAIGGHRRNLLNRIEDMAEDTLCHIFRPGENPENLYPTLNKLLDKIHAEGAAKGPAYLMTSCKNYALDRVSEHLSKKAHTGRIYGYNSDGEYGVVDPGTAQDHDVIDPDEKLILRESMDQFLSECGQDFARDLVFLAARVAELPRATITDYFFRNEATELVLLVATKIRWVLNRDISEQLAFLLEQSRTYRVPERHRNNHKSLEDYLYRQTGKSGVERLWKRWNSCNE